MNAPKLDSIGLQLTAAKAQQRNPKVVLALGQIVITAQAAMLLEKGEVAAAIKLHACGNWGNCDEHDRKVNDSALIHGQQILSVWPSIKADKFWIITDPDRSVTTVLMPDDY